jgi:hypothetical protein
MNTDAADFRLGFRDGAKTHARGTKHMFASGMAWTAGDRRPTGARLPE